MKKKKRYMQIRAHVSGKVATISDLLYGNDRWAMKATLCLTPQHKGLWPEEVFQTN